MKRIYICLKKFRLIFITFGLLFVSLFCYSAENLDVTVDEIYFNHIDGNTNDALTISDNGTPIIPYEDGPEWIANLGEVHKFAYIMGQASRSIKVRLNAGLYTGLMHLLIKVSYTSGTGTDGIGEVCNLFVPNFNTDSLLTLYPTGTFPAAVGVHEFHWHWDIYAIPINNPGYCAYWASTDTSHHFYTLLAAPKSPMTQPWERVLDKACTWANGQTSYENVAQKVTEGIYYMGDLDGDIDYVTASYYTQDYYKFNLRNFLSSINTTNTVVLNCTDCANLFNIFSASLGCQSQSKMISRGMNTNSIDPIGSTYGWVSVYWEYHQFGLFNNMVFDPCIRFVSNGNQIVPTNMSLNSYYTSLLTNGTPPSDSATYTTEIITN